MIFGFSKRIFKISGDERTQVISIRNVVKNSYSVGTGQMGFFYGNLTDINTTYYSKY